MNKTIQGDIVVIGEANPRETVEEIVSRLGLDASVIEPGSSGSFKAPVSADPIGTIRVEADCQVSVQWAGDVIRKTFYGRGKTIDLERLIEKIWRVEGRVREILSIPPSEPEPEEPSELEVKLGEDATQVEGKDGGRSFVVGPCTLSNCGDLVTVTITPQTLVTTPDLAIDLARFLRDVLQEYRAPECIPEQSQEDTAAQATVH